MILKALSFQYLFSELKEASNKKNGLPWTIVGITFIYEKEIVKNINFDKVPTRSYQITQIS